MKIEVLILFFLFALPLAACDKCQVPHWLVLSYHEEAQALIDAIERPFEEGKLSPSQVVALLAGGLEGGTAEELEICQALERLHPYLSHLEVQEIFSAQAKVDQEWAEMLAPLQN